MRGGCHPVPPSSSAYLLAALIGELAMRSDDFARMWATGDVSDCTVGAMHLRHPTVGAVNVDHQVWLQPDSPDHRVEIYTPRDSASADALHVLNQQNAGPPSRRRPRGPDSTESIGDIPGSSVRCMSSLGGACDCPVPGDGAVSRAGARPWRWKQRNIAATGSAKGVAERPAASPSKFFSIVATPTGRPVDTAGSGFSSVGTNVLTVNVAVALMRRPCRGGPTSEAGPQPASAPKDEQAP